jgi:ATP-dependent RNA helicase RhlE
LTQFTDLGLAKPLLKALADEGYVNPTPIQAQAIPGVMSGKDLLGIAQTGTGKTAAFALPILHRLAEDRKPATRRSARVLVLAPTRELATQIGESFKSYGKHLGVSVAVVFGGVKYGAQMKAMAPGVDVLVATPGRLLDHLAEKNRFCRWRGRYFTIFRIGTMKPMSSIWSASSSTRISTPSRVIDFSPR